MHRNANRILLSLALVLALGSVTPAIADAGRWGPGTPSRATGQRPTPMPRATCHQYCSSVAQHLSQRRVFTGVRPRIVTVVAESGFNWSDAAIGFGAACGLVLLSLGSLLLRRQAILRQAREPA